MSKKNSVTFKCWKSIYYMQNYKIVKKIQTCVSITARHREKHSWPDQNQHLDLNLGTFSFSMHRQTYSIWSKCPEMSLKDVTCSLISQCIMNALSRSTESAPTFINSERHLETVFLKSFKRHFEYILHIFFTSVYLLFISLLCTMISADFLISVFTSSSLFLPHSSILLRHYWFLQTGFHKYSIFCYTKYFIYVHHYYLFIYFW